MKAATLSFQQAKVALVYDRLNTPYGGAEQLLIALKELFPQAIVYTSLYDKRRATWAKDWLVKTSFLQHWPLATRLHRYLAIFMPLAFENLDLSAYDIVISVTSAEAKSVITRADQLHICYLLSPPRYLYHYQHNYLADFAPMRWPILGNIVRRQLQTLADFDQIAIHRPDVVVPISQIVAQRVKRYYQKLKTAPVIYPPLDTHISQQLYLTKQSGQAVSNNHDGNYLLLVSRLVPYKHVDAAISASISLKKKLVVVGSGPEETKLKRLARKLERQAGFAAEELIVFKKNLHPKILAKTYLACQAVLSPGLDDFGLAALEANLYGKPVLVNQLSGAAEIIRHGVHGLHLAHQEQDSLATLTNNLIQGIQQLEKSHFDSQVLSKNASKYDTTKFTRAFGKLVTELYQAKKNDQL